jgi:hypothetical protein
MSRTFRSRVDGAVAADAAESVVPSVPVIITAQTASERAILVPKDLVGLVEGMFGFIAPLFCWVLGVLTGTADLTGTARYLDWV